MRLVESLSYNDSREKLTIDKVKSSLLNAELMRTPLGSLAIESKNLGRNRKGNSDCGQLARKTRRKFNAIIARRWGTRKLNVENGKRSNIN